MFSGSFRSALVLLQLFSVIQSTNGNAFLKASPSSSDERMSEQEIKSTLLAEVEGGLGTSAGSKVVEFEAVLKSVFKALPKNEQGGLSHATVRYALHRIFVQRHGWFIQGLDRAGESWNGSSPTGILKDQVPAYVQDMFEKRLDGKGLHLHELAVLAATIEHLVHNEALSKLGAALEIHSRLPTEELSAADANEILETYMMSYIIGKALDPSKKTLTVINKLKERMSQIYLAWPDTQVFIKDVTANITGDAENVNFATLARIAEKMGEQFGAFQATECHVLKEKLLTLEDRGTGRVRLSDFYRPAFGGHDGAWQFKESLPYLQQLGAIDETVPEDPKVIVSNYLGSQANCMASSSFYAVCCMDECESILTHLEEDIKASEAPPSRIAALISALPSATVTAPRELPVSLLRRLDEIGATHGGTVPLHGRLFAQWMHHAYPRECPYPHVSGTTAPMAALDWKQESGLSHTATDDEIEQVVQDSMVVTSSNVTEDELGELMPWSDEEELLVVRPPQFSTSGRTSVPETWRGALLFAMAVSVALSLVRNFRYGSKVDEEACQKFYV